MCAAATKLLEPSTAARTRVEPRHSDMWYGLLNPLFTAVLNYHPSSAHLLSCIVYLLLSCRSFYMFYNQMIYHTQYSWLAFSFCGYSTHKFLITSMIYKNILHLIHCIFTHLKTPFEAKKKLFHSDTMQGVFLLPVFWSQIWETIVQFNIINILVAPFFLTAIEIYEGKVWESVSIGWEGALYRGNLKFHLARINSKLHLSKHFILWPQGFLVWPCRYIYSLRGLKCVHDQKAQLLEEIRWKRKKKMETKYC